MVSLPFRGVLYLNFNFYIYTILYNLFIYILSVSNF